MASGKTSSAARIMASKNRLSLYDRAPREIWMMNGALPRACRVAVGIRLAQVAPEQAHGLLQVVDVIRADGILAVGVGKELLGCDNHAFRFLV